MLKLKPMNLTFEKKIIKFQKKFKKILDKWFEFAKICFNAGNCCNEFFNAIISFAFIVPYATLPVNLSMS